MRKAALLSLKLKYVAPVLLCLLLLSSSSYSQKQETAIRKIYAQGAIGPTTPDGFMTDWGVQAVFKNNWTASFSVLDIHANPKNLPRDYDAGYIIIIFLPIPNAVPEHHAQVYSVTAGKCFEGRRATWFTTEAGVSVVKGDRFSFTSQQVVSDFLGKTANYTARSEDHTTVGGLLKADLNWAFSSFAGLGIGVFASLNSIQSHAGLELKLIAGWMNRKPKPKARVKA